MTNHDSNIMNDRNNEYSLNEFLRAIHRFTDVRQVRKNIFDIYSEGLYVFNELPGTIKSALFTIMDELPDFELKLTKPENIENEIISYYDKLLNSGHIGISLNSATVINVSLKNIDNSQGSVLIIPLKKSRGINGIILVFHSNESDDLAQYLIRLCNVFSNLLGSSIENYHILNQLEQSKAILEQRIATRTIDLAQSRRELKAVFDSVLTGVLVFDVSINKIVRVNPSACKLIGLQDSEIVGRSVFEFLSFVDYTKIVESNGTTENKYYDSELLDASGKKVEVLRNTIKIRLSNRTLITESFVDISKIRAAERALTETNHILESKVEERTGDLHSIVKKLKQEIIEREKVESELRKMYNQQKELGDMKTRFVSMVSHEFRTPLTLIKSSAQMVSRFESKLSESDKSFYLERIVRSVDNLTDLIENVIFFGRNESGKIEMKISEFDIKNMLFLIAGDFKSGRNVNRNFIISCNTVSSNIKADKSLIHLILTNLISNAVKYSEEDTEIEINIILETNRLTVSIKDYGIGIPETEKPRIFDLFYRAGNVDSVGGTGLGLTVVKDTLDKLGGTIDIHSATGEGTIIRVRIPISYNNPEII